MNIERLHFQWQNGRVKRWKWRGFRDWIWARIYVSPATVYHRQLANRSKYRSIVSIFYVYLIAMIYRRLMPSFLRYQERNHYYNHYKKNTITMYRHQSLL